MALTKHEKLAEYFIKVLRDPSPMVYLAAVGKLIRLCEDDTDRDFRNTAVSNGLIKCLTDVLCKLPAHVDNQKDNMSLYIPTMTTAGLKCLYLFCSIRSYYHKKFVDLSFLSCLLRYASPRCDPSWRPFGCFNQYSPAFTEKLKDIISSCDGGLKVMTNLKRCANVQQELTFYEPALAQVPDVLKSSSSIRYVELRGRKSSNPDAVLDVNGELIRQELAWKKCPEPGEPSSTSSSGQTSAGGLKSKSRLSLDNIKWRDCFVDEDNILNGNFMWALLDRDAMEMSDLISESLQEKASLGHLKRVKPSVGDMVVAKLKSFEDQVSAFYFPYTVKFICFLFYIYSLSGRSGQVHVIVIHFVVNRFSYITLTRMYFFLSNMHTSICTYS